MDCPHGDTCGYVHACDMSMHAPQDQPSPQSGPESLATVNALTVNALIVLSLVVLQFFFLFFVDLIQSSFTSHRLSFHPSSRARPTQCCHIQVRTKPYNSHTTIILSSPPQNQTLHPSAGQPRGLRTEPPKQHYCQESQLPSSPQPGITN